MFEIELSLGNTDIIMGQQSIAITITLSDRKLIILVKALGGRPTESVYPEEQLAYFVECF